MGGNTKLERVPEGARRQWAADRALRAPMRSPGRPEPSRAVRQAGIEDNIIPDAAELGIAELGINVRIYSPGPALVHGAFPASGWAFARPG